MSSRFFFFSSRRRHTRFKCDWSSDVCSSDLIVPRPGFVLHQFAWQSTQTEAWARDYYLCLRKEGKSHSEAVRALANLWVRIIFAIWNKKEGYQTSTFEAAQQLHAKSVV